MHSASLVPCFGRCFGFALVLAAMSGTATAQNTGAATAKKDTAKQEEPKKAEGVLRPTISEVLFIVPKGSEGDANGDGVRSATGDEFVEIYNPHDKPIQLKGYRLTDGTPASAKKNPPKTDKQDDANKSKDGQSEEREHVPFEFVFPEFELGAGQVAVVFNGFESNLTGEFGTSAKAAKANDKFHGAFVFNAAMTTQYAAFSNTHDLVQLVSPEGDAVETVTWDYRDSDKGGKNAKKNDQNAQQVSDKHGEKSGGTVRILPNMRIGSAQIRTVDGDFVSHVAAKGSVFSPGQFSPEKEAKAGKDESKKSNPDD